MTVSFKSQGSSITKADYYINDMHIGSSVSPFKFSFTPEDIDSITTGTNMLTVVVYDSQLNKDEETVSFKIIN